MARSIAWSFAVSVSKAGIFGSMKGRTSMSQGAGDARRIFGRMYVKCGADTTTCAEDARREVSNGKMNMRRTLRIFMAATCWWLSCGVGPNFSQTAESGLLESCPHVPTSVLSVLDRACLDCHSNETRWPWYNRLPRFRGLFNVMWTKAGNT